MTESPEATEAFRRDHEKLLDMGPDDFFKKISEMPSDDCIKAFITFAALARTSRATDFHIRADALSAFLRKRIAEESISSMDELRGSIKKFNRTSSIYSGVIIALTVVMAFLAYQTLRRSAEMTSLIELLKKFLGEWV